MREDLVTPATARRLANEGLGWEPQIGDAPLRKID